MSTPAPEPARRGRQLLRCPRCGSRLIYPRTITAGDPVVIFDRRCPDCEYCDAVAVSALGADVWLHHEQKLRSELESLADALANGQPIELSDVFAP